MKTIQTLAAVLVVALATACTPGGKAAKDDGAGTAMGSQGGATSGVGDGGMSSGGAMGGDSAGGALGGPTASQENRVVYFEFDRFDIKPEYNAILQAHARYLSSNPTAKVRLEGHADERGSREYNIGLGEKRAQAVRSVLLLQGAVAGQVNTVSFGEERPAVIGSDEEAWSLNRRVEIVYGN